MSVRIDKWLWAARFFKTRGLAQVAIDNGRVLLGDARIKPAHAVKVGDRLVISAGERTFEIEVLGLSEVRGPAPVAQALYLESEASIARRAAAAERRRYAHEPAATIAGRPTKRDRREIGRVRDSFE
jgi:ribosome-associated heat shock protein Hsp15